MISSEIDKVKEVYSNKRDEIISRLRDFKQVWNDKNEEFKEFVFCLLTPQSKAKLCWKAVKNLEEKGMLWESEVEQVSRELALAGVRFHNKKAEYIVENREKFSRILYTIECGDGRDNYYDIREYIVKNTKGMGYKEASHFLRNIGLGRDVAILDRHILKNLKSLGVIDEIPGSLSKKRYLKIEDEMRAFSDRTGIPLSHLDLVLWYKETGEIFK